jgi:lambda family phage portal protein
MLRAIRNIFTGKAKPAANKQSRLAVRGRYDAAQHSDNSRKHWAMADGLSARAANSAQVRRTLRNRSRYEVANNSYAKGIVLTLANDVIGTGPRLQMLALSPEDNRLIEREFSMWAAAIGLADKLRTLRIARAQDGESFALLTNNSQIPTRVRLDLRLIEAEQISSDLKNTNDDTVDGIAFDAFGNPRSYTVLRNHPGDAGFARQRATRVPAEAIIHDFRVERPGQARGIPEITPALPLFAMLRDYSLATLDAAKAAAYFAGVLYTDAPAHGEAEDVEPMDAIELERNMLMTMPGGWKLGQVKAEHPSASYAEFKHEILNEIARCLNMPFNIAAGNSSGYNYASGRLDHQTYFKSIRVDQAHIEQVILGRIFAAWHREAVLIEGYLPQRLRRITTDWSHQWFWDGNEHVDPAKEANAQATRLKHRTTTLADEYAKRGQDWETQLRQIAKEQALLTELGLTTENVQETKSADEVDEDEQAPQTKEPAHAE